MVERDVSPLSEAQMEIMTLVWEHGELAVSEVWAILARRRALARNTVQTLLVRMEEKGWIDSEWGQSENNRRAKYYKLTKTGRKQLETESEGWERMVLAIGRVMQTA